MAGQEYLAAESRFTKAQLIDHYVANAGRTIAPDPAYLRRQLAKCTKAQILMRMAQLGIPAPTLPETMVVTVQVTVVVDTRGWTGEYAEDPSASGVRRQVKDYIRGTVENACPATCGLWTEVACE